MLKLEDFLIDIHTAKHRLTFIEMILLREIILISWKKYFIHFFKEKPDFNRILSLSDHHYREDDDNIFFHELLFVFVFYERNKNPFSSNVTFFYIRSIRQYYFNQ